MKLLMKLMGVASIAGLAGANTAYADVSEQTLKSLGAPDKIETSAGALEFKDGVPTVETATKVYNTLDFTNALNAYNNSFRGASALAIVKGFEGIGAKPGDVVIFSELMDSNSLFLTPNADTIYYLTGLDLSKGPLVIEQPSNAVGAVNDMWFSWVIDIGGPGPDRGLGGKYLIVGPDYDGPLPEGGYFIGHSKTNLALYAARAYLVDDDPKPAVENVKENLKIYPYQPGSYGTSIAQALEGTVRIAGEPKITAWNLPSLGHTADAATPLILAPWTGSAGQVPVGNNSGAPAPAAGTGGSSTGGVAGACTTSSSTTGGYSVNVCFADPLSGATLSGDVPVTATVAVTGARTNVQDLVFYLDGSYLLTAYSSPYTFLLPTANWANGSYSLSVEAHMRDKFTSQPGTLPVIFNNAAASNPASTTRFQPSTGITPPNGAPFTVAAGGDGAGGEPTATKVTNLIASLKPDLFLYLGDVYENGSPAEFLNWYGTTSNFGQFRAITDPTVGNHEYLTPGAAGYFNYWNNIPSYYSFNAGSWHFISLNANLAKLGSAGQSAQYQWLQQDLSANANGCTIVYYHQPLFNIGPEGSATDMTSIWSLLAQYGVTIVLNGHDHDYQRWVPLDGNGQPAANGITEFVVGSAGHGLQTIANTDSRVAYYNDTPPAAFGVLLLQLSQGSAGFTYQSTNGSTLDSGVIPCNHATPVSYVPGFLHGPFAGDPGMAVLAVAWVAAPAAASRRPRYSPFSSKKS